MSGISGTWGWLEHLTEDDRALLTRVGREAGIDPGRLQTDEAALAAVLCHPSVFGAVWTDRTDEALVRSSPFLVFATAVHRGWVDLQGARHVAEWVGTRQRLPVLGGEDLRAFLAGGPRRLFLTSLLTSYTRVASGSTWVHTRRGWRRRRFSELDPVRLASLLEVVPAEERPGVYRRLGDLALFLTGVFPDHTALHAFRPLAEGRLLRAGGIGGQRDLDRGSALISGSVGLLEHLGQRWYELACRTADPPLAGTMEVVAEVAEQFTVARRVLNLVTDRYLYPVRSRWFGSSAG
jgi:hypothetical protein